MSKLLLSAVTCLVLMALSSMPAMASKLDACADEEVLKTVKDLILDKGTGPLADKMAEAYQLDKMTVVFDENSITLEDDDVRSHSIICGVTYTLKSANDSDPNPLLLQLERMGGIHQRIRYKIQPTRKGVYISIVDE
jgi:hypothetical protein